MSSSALWICCAFVAPSNVGSNSGNRSDVSDNSLPSALVSICKIGSVIHLATQTETSKEIAHKIPSVAPKSKG